MSRRFITFALGVMTGALGHNYLAKKENTAPFWGVLGDPLPKVIKAYTEYLRRHHPAHEARFIAALRNNTESAGAEAAIFSWLQKYPRVNPRVNEDPAAGGTDFLCTGMGDNFTVEVTVLREDTVVRHSRIPAVRPAGVFRIENLTAAIFRTIQRKATQMAGYPYARVLAIAATHQAAQMLLDTSAAERILISEPALRWSAEPGTPAETVTNLDKSVFFRPENAAIVACRQSISAVILVGLFHERLTVIGAVHPSPAHRFRTDIFPQVPFARVAKWPILDGNIELEWTVGTPRPEFYRHIAASG